MRSERWKYVHCSGKRERTDGYKTANPTPGRTIRLYDLAPTPGNSWMSRHSIPKW